MPALPNVPNVLKIALVHTYSADLDVRTHIFAQYSGTPPSASGLDSMATSIGTAWNTDMAPLHSTLVTLTAVEIVDLSSPTSFSGSATVSHAGTRTGGALTAGTCVLNNFTLGRRYRGGKPKQFWPAFTDTDVDTGQLWNSASVTAFNTGWGNFITAVSGTTPSGTTWVSQVNVSYYEGFTVVTSPTTGRARNVPKLRTGGPQVDAITSNTVSQRIASQRRRLGKTP